MTFPRKEFDKMHKLASKYSIAKRDFDQLVTDCYGVHYSDVDDDYIIDALDYGTGAITYEEFCERMEKYSKEHSD